MYIAQYSFFSVVGVDSLHFKVLNIMSEAHEHYLRSLLNKGKYQLQADQHLCFPFDSTIHLLPKSKIPSL